MENWSRIRAAGDRDQSPADDNRCLALNAAGRLKARITPALRGMPKGEPAYASDKPVHQHEPEQNAPDPRDPWL